MKTINEPVGFKEWSLICEAMGEGKQTIILRKGGIAEGRAGFAFQYPRFHLFPTLFHEQLDQVRYEPPADWVDPGVVEGEPVTVSYRVEMEASAVLDDWSVIASLAPFHVWAEEVIEERFNYTENRCLHLAVVRVYRLKVPWTFPYERSFKGCRSWIQLPTGSDQESLPVLADSEHARQLNELREKVPDLTKLQ